jgi:hypothetical protein
MLKMVSGDVLTGSVPVVSCGDSAMLHVPVRGYHSEYQLLARTLNHSLALDRHLRQMEFPFIDAN